MQDPTLRPADFALLIIPPLLWSTMIVAGRAVGGVIPPLALTFWTWLAAALVLAVPVVRARAAVCAAAAGEWPIWIAASLLGVTLFQGLYYLGLERTSAINAALLSPTQTLMIAVGAAVLLGEPLSLRQTIGAVLGFAGAGWIAVGGDPAQFGAFEFAAGDSAILAANLAMAGYTLLVRARPSRLDATAYMGVLAILGTVACVPLLVWEQSDGRAPAWSAPAMAAVVYIGVVTYALGYVFWNRSVARAGATMAAVFLYLIPPFGVALATLVLGEPLRSYHVIGAALIFTGIYFCLHRRGGVPQSG